MELTIFIILGITAVAVEAHKQSKRKWGENYE